MLSRAGGDESLLLTTLKFKSKLVVSDRAAALCWVVFVTVCDAVRHGIIRACHCCQAVARLPSRRVTCWTLSRIGSELAVERFNGTTTSY